MSPKMKRELLLALDAMLDNREFHGRTYRGQPDTEDHFPRVGFKANGKWRDLVWIHLDYRTLRTGNTLDDPGFLWIMGVIGCENQQLEPGFDWFSTIGGPLTIHALHAVVREELSKLPVV